jgi:hypothetical protein
MCGRDAGVPAVRSALGARLARFAYHGKLLGRLRAPIRSRSLLQFQDAMP